ncbi:hypothetical protein [Pseudomonas sp. GOM6]|uniref:hypothetical protein n=1 Tax=Pseudomonas sp. GOM6 TaxID=3036944 RepID=UPI0024093CDF|nr:hypothetical protein [Pseudomonas sp. GOM6]MDG1580972.1 hypothetical protein [Pseudomonas sp. GOM6]
MFNRTITISLTGQTESDVDDAFEEAITRLKAGNVSGSDQNKTSSFSFENVPTEEVSSKADEVSEGAQLLVSLDGGQTFQPAPSGVRLIFPDVEVDDEDGPTELHLNATQEGLISDLYTTRGEHLDHIIGTDSQLVSDIVERLVTLGA